MIMIIPFHYLWSIGRGKLTIISFCPGPTFRSLYPRKYFFYIWNVFDQEIVNNYVVEYLSKVVKGLYQKFPCRKLLFETISYKSKNVTNCESTQFYIC